MAAARRTDADRLAAARLSDLCAERACCQYALDLKRRELAAEVRRPGGSWSSPRAVELDHGCRAALKEWETAATAVVAELTARRDSKETQHAPD
jgi:hypothetical protein